MQAIRRGVNGLLGAIRIIAAVLLVASVAVNFANIIGRYFFAVSLHWAEEVMLFLMIGCVFLGTGLVGWGGKHIRMDVIATCLAVAVFAWPVITMLAQFDQRSQAANVPLVIPQAMLPIGLSLMALLIAMRLIFQESAQRDRPGDVAD